jgi:hypothetical protein
VRAGRRGGAADMTSESTQSQPTERTEHPVSQKPAPDRSGAWVDELLGAMTLAEKAGQLTQYFYFRLPDTAVAEPAFGADLTTRPGAVEAALERGEAGSQLFVTDPAEVNRLQRLAVEGNRLGIPLLFGFDVIHGLRTIFPVPIAMAAFWNLETIERGQAVAAREARAVGIHWAFAPMVDFARDPRWGRSIEGGPLANWPTTCSIPATCTCGSTTSCRTSTSGCCAPSARTA